MSYRRKTSGLYEKFTLYNAYHIYCEAKSISVYYRCLLQTFATRHYIVLGQRNFQNLHWPLQLPSTKAITGRNAKHSKGAEMSCTMSTFINTMIN